DNRPISIIMGQKAIAGRDLTLCRSRPYPRQEDHPVASDELAGNQILTEQNDPSHFRSGDTVHRG
ncbi:MAG: hypothetical protein JSU72_20375, partial [Deltaproteobacteria bacterium]